MTTSGSYHHDPSSHVNLGAEYPSPKKVNPSIMAGLDKRQKVKGFSTQLLGSPKTMHQNSTALHPKPWPRAQNPPWDLNPPQALPNPPTETLNPKHPGRNLQNGSRPPPPRKKIRTKRQKPQPCKPFPQDPRKALKKTHRRDLARP